MPLRSPVGELLGYWRSLRATKTEVRPEGWPPIPGQVWEDRDRDRWICTTIRSGLPYLVCIARQAEDNAEEILRTQGPLSRVDFVTPNGEEPPF